MTLIWMARSKRRSRRCLQYSLIWYSQAPAVTSQTEWITYGGLGAPYGNDCPGGAGAGACNDHWQCSDGAGGSGSCSFDLSYYGTDCGNERPGGASNPWSGHGRCSEVHGTCTCQASDAGHWRGSDRCAFASGYYGPSCTQCPECGDGSCNEGLTGDGWCTCVSDVYGPNCGSQCAGGKSNPCNGHG